MQIIEVANHIYPSFFAYVDLYSLLQPMQMKYRLRFVKSERWCSPRLLVVKKRLLALIGFVSIHHDDGRHLEQFVDPYCLR
jgi:hypothetical protein